MDKKQKELDAEEEWLAREEQQQQKAVKEQKDQEDAEKVKAAAQRKKMGGKGLAGAKGCRWQGTSPWRGKRADYAATKD